MAMTPVKSSNIKGVDHNPATGHLIVEFHSGQKWEYDDAAHHHGPMLAAESVGKYFHAHVRGKHEGRRIDG